MASGANKALNLLRNLPRVTLNNIKPLPGQRKKKQSTRGQYKSGNSKISQRGQNKHNTLPTIGYEGGQVPFTHIIPTEPYYKGHHVRRQYPPISLLQLQRMIDLGRVNVEEPIDLTALCNTKILRLDLQRNHYGVHITDEGADIFCTKINLEAQIIDELSIAAIEKAGGTVTTRYYDPVSVEAMSDPLKFFKKGLPIPRCKFPPEDAILYYSDAKKRGYLADSNAINEHRYELSQKYGYVLSDISQDQLASMLLMRKHRRQIWYGLEPGWVVNLRDKTILKPTSEQLQNYYAS